MVLLACAAASGQSRVTVCDITAVNNVTDCYSLNTSKIGGLKFEDYKVTNPSAVQFDPAVRLKELAALGPSTAAILCGTLPEFISPAPTITFDTTKVQAQIYSNTTPFARLQFVDAQFTDFRASNGYSSPSFGVRMVRTYNPDGTVAPQYGIQVQQGNAGLGNVEGLTPGVGFNIDPTVKSATQVGTVPSLESLRQAIFGVFAHVKSIMSAATFTVTAPPPPGLQLWTGPEIIALAGQAEPWIAAAPGNLVPLGPPLNCRPGDAACDGDSQITDFSNMLLTWGGEYLGLRTKQSFNVLVDNLRLWATANAPSIDPAYALSPDGPSNFEDKKRPISTSLLMLWPTLRDDPALSSSDRQLIENWLVNRLVVLPGSPNFLSFPNDLGEWASEVVMADAIRRSDNAGFAHGIQRFYGALYQMRPDGSFPLSARLSACSAAYSNTDILHLVTMAEMAATQGYDLYSLTVNGKSLDTAIKFLLDAHENPTLLSQYSNAGGGFCWTGRPGDPPNFDLVFGPGSLSNLAWMEPYLARFPFSSTAARIRNILGSNTAADPFPLMISRTGVNATCAFRKPYEFQPVNGAKVTIVSGDGQILGPDQPTLAPLSVRVTDNSGKALAGVLVSFAVTQGSANLSSPAQVLTDATGLASASVAVASGPVTVTAAALRASASFSIGVPGMAIYSGGIAGIGASLPALTNISSGALFSIYGQNFVPAGTGRRANPDELVNGVLPSTLLGVCVSVAGQSAPMLDVYPGQINAVAPRLAPNSKADVIVTTGCGTSSAVQSTPESVTVAPVSPEFLYFAHNPDGLNPVAAVDSVTGAFIGPTELGASFSPALPGDLITVFASGFGPAPTIPGAPYAGPAASGSVTVRLGSITLDPKDVLYVGGAPGQLISQLNIRIPQGLSAGKQPLQIRFDVPSIVSLPGPYLAIGAP